MLHRAEEGPLVIGPHCGRLFSMLPIPHAMPFREIHSFVSLLEPRSPANWQLGVWQAEFQLLRRMGNKGDTTTELSRLTAEEEKPDLRLFLQHPNGLKLKPAEEVVKPLRESKERNRNTARIRCSEISNAEFLVGVLQA